MRTLVLISFLLTACTGPALDKGDTADPVDTADAVDTADTDELEAPEWGYGAENGPEKWGELSEEWATCATGQAQSPVDIETAQLVHAPVNLALDWKTTALRAYNPGHYIRYEVDEGSTITTDAGVFELVQFHFHGGSEHTVDGERFDAEVHFVHVLREDPSQLAVVALVLDAGAGSVETDVFGADGPLRFHDAVALPVSEEPTELGGSVDLGATFEGLADSVATYMGSLTTPPCTEGVAFYVAGWSWQPAQADVDALHAVYDDNFRPTQPLNGRVITVLSDF